MSFRWSACFILFLSSFASAQIAQPFSSISADASATCGTISTRVVTPGGQSLSGASVEMHAIGEVAPTGLAIDSLSDADSHCTAPGWYRITAHYGRSQSSEDVNVGPGQVVMITLRLPLDSATGGAATVSAAQLQVPQKVRKALEKAQNRLLKKDDAGAMKFIGEALKAYPDSSEAYRLRGLISLMNGHAGDAVNDLNHAVKLDSNNVMARIILGAAFNTMSNFREALTSLNAVLPMAPQSWQAQYELGKAYAGVGDMSHAMAAIDRALAMNPGFAPMRFMRAQLLVRVHQYAAAVRDLHQFLHEAPSGPDSDRARHLLASVQAK